MPMSAAAADDPDASAATAAAASTSRFRALDTALGASCFVLCLVHVDMPKTEAEAGSAQRFEIG